MSVRDLVMQIGFIMITVGAALAVLAIIAPRRPADDAPAVPEPSEAATPPPAKARDSAPRARKPATRPRKAGGRKT